MYTNGVYTLHHVDAITKSAWVCTLEVNGFTSVGEGYTPRGAMSAANRAMSKKMEFKYKMEKNRDVIEDIMADTVIKTFFDKVEEKVKWHRGRQ